jgi:PD-(D/E)XK nuclease superfamily
VSTPNEFILDDFLSDSPLVSSDSAGSDDTGTESFSRVSWKEPGYEGKIDYRIRQLSYSSVLTLHSCPRKFQLAKLRTTFRTEESEKSNITFAYGHIVGEALQLAIEGRSEQEIIWRMFLGWHTDLFAEDPKLNKSFFGAVIALKRFLSLQSAGFLKEYDLVYYNGKPACELSFAVHFPDGFRLRGFVDAVLVHRETGKVLVLECKTTGSATINPATYKNSAQAIGYSIVLDSIFPNISSYEVLYLIYNTKSGEYLPIPFQKTYLQRALWIRELLLDIETIKMYEEAEVYPMHGESCYSFFRECEYLNVCQLSTEYLTKPCTADQEDKTEYQITLTLDDLLTTQLAKAEL